MRDQEPIDNVKAGLDYVRQQYGQAERPPFGESSHDEPSPPPPLAEQDRELDLREALMDEQHMRNEEGR